MISFSPLSSQQLFCFCQAHPFSVSVFSLLIEVHLFSSKISKIETPPAQKIKLPVFKNFIHTRVICFKCCNSGKTPTSSKDTICRVSSFSETDFDFKPSSTSFCSCNNDFSSRSTLCCACQKINIYIQFFVHGHSFTKSNYLKSVQVNRPKQILHKNSFKSKIMLQEFENTCITLTKHLGYLNCFSSCESNDSSNSLGNGFFRNNHHFPYMSSSFQMPVELIQLYIIYNNCIQVCTMIYMKLKFVFI